jgi:hypothetical protein
MNKTINQKIVKCGLYYNFKNAIIEDYWRRTKIKVAISFVNLLN